MQGVPRQNGVILLSLVIIIALAAITYYFSTVSPAELKLDRLQQTRVALKVAKHALISYALTHVDRPGDAGEFGDLPCPDANGNINGPGQADPTCGTNYSVSTLGYLPWKTLGINALKDYSGTCLYYAVSPGYKTTPNLVMLNDDTNGLIQIVNGSGAVILGASADTRPVAVVLAAGAALSGQNRTPDSSTICGLDYNNLSAYLDTDGITDNSIASTGDNVIRQFVGAFPGSVDRSPPLNDQLITISRNDIWTAILKRKDFKYDMNNLTQAIALCLVDYAADNTGRRLPWPAPVGLSGGDYRVNSNYTDAAGGLYAGRMPYDVSNSSTAAGVATNILFNTPGCNALTLANGTVVDLQNLSSQYGRLWQNWKDHFFYAISKVYEPVSGASSETQCNQMMNNCITVASVPYAGVVFYSGTPLSGESRDAPPPTGDANDKANISNYLENGNDIIFKNATGTQTDAYKSNGPITNTANDVMWCIKSVAPGSNLTVTPC